MSEICVFAGTTEGRRLAEWLRGRDVRVLACVATEYGQTLMPEGENIEIAAGRMDEGQMEALFARRRFDAVIDATHPFATQVSEFIASACAATGTACLRLNRAEDAEGVDAVWVDSIRGAAAFLAGQPGSALLATGSKELGPYTEVEGYRERFYPRVLPMASSLEACAAAGFSPAHIIAMQGPFSVEMNVATLKSIRAKWLVTKDSGDSGGFREKLEAARLAGARCVVIGRPKQAEGMGFAQVVDWLKAKYGFEDARRVDVVGIGMGAPGTLTFEADEALRACDCVIGAARMVEAVSGYGKPAFEEIAPAKIAARIAEHPEYARVAVVMSGDTGFFSGTKKLLPLLAGYETRVLPGLSSLQVLCARLGTGWDDVHVMSLHGRQGSVVPAVKRFGRVFALTDGADAVRRVCADLCRAGLGDAEVAVGQRLSYPDEAILRGRADELAETDCAPLSAMLIERAPEALPLPVGLPDEAFLRQLGEDGRTVPMTKSEARAVSIAKLRLTEDAVVWDVGAGTGSVSVECAQLCPKGQVWAVECREDAADLIERNAEQFALRNLNVVRGSAPEALSDLPAPTHVFIGGSSGNMGDILALIAARNPEARVVVNAIAAETVGEIARLAREMGYEERELVQLNVSRGKAAGRYTLMTGLNPIWIAALAKVKGGEDK